MRNEPEECCERQQAEKNFAQLPRKKSKIDSSYRANAWVCARVRMEIGEINNCDFVIHRMCTELPSNWKHLITAFKWSLLGRAKRVHASAPVCAETWIATSQVRSTLFICVDRRRTECPSCDAAMHLVERGWHTMCRVRAWRQECCMPCVI